MHGSGVWVRAGLSVLHILSMAVSVAMTLGGALLLRQHFGSIRRLMACGTYGGYSGGSSLWSVRSFTRLGSSLAVLVCLHLGQQSVSSQPHFPRLVSGSIVLFALGQQSVGLQLHSLRLVNDSTPTHMFSPVGRREFFPCMCSSLPDLARRCAPASDIAVAACCMLRMCRASWRCTRTTSSGRVSL